MRHIAAPSRRVFAAAVVALAALTVSADVDASARRTTQATPTTPRLELVGQNFAFEPDGVIQLRYRLVGIVDDSLELAVPPPVIEAPVDTTVTPAPIPEPIPEPLRLTIEVTNYQPLTDSDDVDDLVGSDVDPGVFTGAIDGVAITDLRDRATVADDGSIEFTLDIGTDVVDSVEQRLKFERAGLYPLRVQLLTGDPRDDTIVATAGTIVQRLAGPTDEQAPPPIDLSVVAVTPSPPPRATSPGSAAARAALDVAIDLAATLDAPVTLEVPPTLVAEEAATPQGSERLAAALEGDELVALPIVPLDVSSAVAAGRADTYTRLVNAGEELLTAAVPTTPAVRTVWMTTDALSAGGAQHLRDLGVRFVIMPAELYRETVSPQLPDTDLFVEAELPDGGTTADPGRRHPHDPAHTSCRRRRPGDLDSHGMVGTRPPRPSSSTATRPMRTTAAHLPNAASILTTPELATPDARLLAGLEDLVATTPSLRFTAASSLIGVTDTQRDDGAPVTVELPDTAGPSLTRRVELIDATAARMVERRLDAGRRTTPDRPSGPANSMH